MAFGFTATAGTIAGTHSGFVGLFDTATFPALALNGPNQILNGGGNLRAYTDDTKANALPLEVVSLVTGGTQNAEVWVRSNSLATAGTVYFEADDTETTQPAVTAPLGRNAVWQDFIYAFHFSVSAGRLVDATGNYSLSESGTVTTIAGKVGDGADSNLNINNFFSVTGYTGISGSAARTHKMWAKTASTGDVGLLEYGTSATGQRMGIRFDDSNITGAFRTEIQGSFAYTNNAFNDNDWHLFVSKFDGTSSFPNCYSANVDGVNQALTTGSTVTLNTVPSSNVMFRQMVGGYANDEYDEYTLRDFETSNDLDATEHDNQNSPSTFWTSGAWEDQGGVIDVSATLGTINYQSNGVVVTFTGDIDVISTLGTIDYVSQNTVVQLSGEIDVISTLGTINYLSQDVDVSVTGDIDVVTTLGTINYQSNNTIVNVSGDILVQATLGTIDYLSKNAVVSITGDIDVISTLGTISYTSQDTTVSLVGGVNVPATLGTISYQSNNAIVELAGLIDVTATLGTIFYTSNTTVVKLSEGQDIGNVTVSFQDDIYTAGFKPDTITVNFK